MKKSFVIRKKQMALAGAGLLIGLAGSASAQFSANFTADTIGADPTGWTEVLGSDFTTPAPAPPNESDWIVGGAATSDAQARGTPPAGQYCVIDDDGAGSGANAADRALVSPSFDATGFATVNLNFQYFYNDYAAYADSFSAHVFDGAVWQQVLNVTADTPATWSTASIDVTAHANANMRVAFRYQDDLGGWLWGAAFDEVAVVGINESISIGDLTQAEGSGGGTTNFNFPITINPAPAGNITMNYTVNHVSTDASDFSGATAGVFTFIGDGVDTVQDLTLTVNADDFPENDETFSVVLDTASSGTLVDDTAAGGITDDDFTCGATEDFATAVGTTPPAGWVVTDHDGGGLVWQFDNPGTRATGMTAPFAIMDSDFNGASGQDEDASLQAPSQDWSAVQFASVNFDMHYRDIGDATDGVVVEVSTDGGTIWDPAFTYSTSQGYPAAAPAPQSIDLSAYTGNADVRVRFRYFAAWSWWCAIDNVEFCTGTAPAGFSVITVSDASVAEGDAGTTNLTFTINASPAAAATIDVDWVVTGGTAISGDDYAATAGGTETFLVTETAQTFDIVVNGDTGFEYDDTVDVQVSVSSGPGFVTDANGTGTMTNDDAFPTATDTFGFNATTDVFQYVDYSTGFTMDSGAAAGGANFGGDFLGNDVVNFFYVDNVDNSLDSIDVTTGTVTPGPTVSGNPASTICLGMSCNPVDGLMYAIYMQTDFTGWSYGTLDTTTGVFASLGTNAAGTLVGLAHGNDGTVYVGSIAALASPFNVDLGTISGNTLTVVGDTTLDSASFCDMDVDPATGILYKASVDTISLAASINTINTNTGVATLVSTPGNGTDQIGAYSVVSPISANVSDWMILND